MATLVLKWWLRRQDIRMWQLVLMILVFSAACSAGAEEPRAPQTVEALWADFDPRRDPLETRVVWEWENEGVIYRYVTFQIGTFRGQPARMAAFYGFPRGSRKIPGVLHLHGGGQRAFQHEVEFYAKRGYGCLSINWGGRDMEEARADDPNTDWGAVDPTQKNVPGYSNLQPGEKTLDPWESPRNNNWYLLTLGARRGLTFLEQQPEIDAGRLGVYGHSMGGNLTVYVAGTDQRVLAAAPSVGGSGFRTQPWPLLPQARREIPRGDAKLFDATLGFESYGKRILCPVLWLGATNDFHGIMDDTYRTGDLIPHQAVRYSWTPHMNHRFTPEFAVTRPLWFDQYLKGQFTFTRTPESTLFLETPDRVPELRVTPDSSQPIASVQIYYSIDPDPRARFWRSAAAVKSEDQTWRARLPVLATDQPLFAFANVTYQMGLSEAEPHARPTDHFAISSKLHTATPQELKQSGVHATDQTEVLIDDFSRGWQDWYLLEAGNPHHWEFSTRKLSDPKWRGQPGQQLLIDVEAEKPNDLVVVMTENFFRDYRGRSQEFVAVVRVVGGTGIQSIALSLDDFKNEMGESLASWANVDVLALRAYYEKNGRLVGSKSWQGTSPTFRRLMWGLKTK